MLESGLDSIHIHLRIFARSRLLSVSFLSNADSVDKRLMYDGMVSCLAREPFPRTVDSRDLTMQVKVSNVFSTSAACWFIGMESSRIKT